MSAPVLWTAADAARAVGADASGQDWRAAGVSIDSRTIAPNELFVALKGPRV
ncbi:MAG: UDP-N-acetylmuramoyl-tripeptide--D-alanyl-D-alanine ligase, partial [Alphaproteobacteria bacterium]|nr:UDP-N-acetylmuramoyl-tripeptide--D-alanyl-D-alanine ligase [Alphaproteobacteria bacterium]